MDSMGSIRILNIPKLLCRAPMANAPIDALNGDGYIILISGDTH
jgi:hypothetical protein